MRSSRKSKFLPQTDQNAIATQAHLCVRQQSTWANGGLPLLFLLRAPWAGCVFFFFLVQYHLNKDVSIRALCTKPCKHGKGKQMHAKWSLKLYKWNTKSAQERLQFNSWGLHWVCYLQAKGGLQVSKQGWSNHLLVRANRSDSLSNLFNMKQH